MSKKHKQEEGLSPPPAGGTDRQSDTHGTLQACMLRCAARLAGFAFTSLSIFYSPTYPPSPAFSSCLLLLFVSLSLPPLTATRWFEP